MLFEPQRHEPLAADPWDAGRAREAIHLIASDTQRQRLPHGGWPLHPKDDEGDEPRGGFKGLYLGSAGVLWALGWLQRQGLATLQFDLAQAIAQVDRDYQDAPDIGPGTPSLFMGESGVLLMHWHLGGEGAVADRLHALLRGQLDHPSQEMFFGVPGMMMAALHAWDASGDERWRALVQAQLEPIWQAWRFDEAAGTHLWTQQVRGSTVQYLGAGHGSAGNLHALLRAAPLMSAAQRETLVQRSVASMRALATVEGDAANWRPGTYTPRPDGPRMLMQWCHGAPGIVTSLAPLPAGQDADLDALLRAAGEAIWRAGPLAKGAGLCHGTAGNGEALLSLHARHPEGPWLERARAFAMHALGQSQRQHDEVGRGRYTLWTGGPGLALFLAQCLDGRAGVPGLDWL